jgi:hypothetical protein
LKPNTTQTFSYLLDVSSPGAITAMTDLIVGFKIVARSAFWTFHSKRLRP